MGIFPVNCFQGSAVAAVDGGEDGAAGAEDGAAGEDDGGASFLFVEPVVFALSPGVDEQDQSRKPLTKDSKRIRRGNRIHED